jgi:RimJ/RimL family protein N-acetyltransferase
VDGLTEIFAIALPENEPSIAVMRRLGMTHLGRTGRWYGIESELYVVNRRSAAFTTLK